MNGERREVDVAVGSTVMEGAVDNNIAGILAECGGQAKDGITGSGFDRFKHGLELCLCYVVERDACRGTVDAAVAGMRQS